MKKIEKKSLFIRKFRKKSLFGVANRAALHISEKPLFDTLLSVLCTGVIFCLKKWSSAPRATAQNAPHPRDQRPPPFPHLRKPCQIQISRQLQNPSSDQLTPPVFARVPPTSSQPTRYPPPILPGYPPPSR